MVSHVDFFKNWEKQGRNDFITCCKKLCKTLDTSPVFPTDGHVSDVTKIVYDLIWNGLRGVIKKDAVVSTISDIAPFHKDILSIVLDVINVIDAETDKTNGGHGTTEERAALGYIVKTSEKIFTEKMLKERLEIDTLQEFKILSNRNFYTKFIKVKTKVYYKQRKFNLFREESEGYAKLITELNQEITGNVSPENIVEVIKSLIGCFNLDPNRVLDVILDSFEMRPEQAEFFVPLIQLYMPDPKILSEVLAFKYGFYEANVVPKSLYKVTALMLQYKIIRLDDIYSWLIPGDKVIRNDWEKEMQEAKEYVRKLNIVSMKGTDKEKEDQPEERVDDSLKYERNQKFNLCEALLEIGDWQTVSELSQRLPDFCLMDQPPLAHAMCQLIHSLIEPVYRSNTGLGARIKGKPYPQLPWRLAPPPARDFLELRRHVMPMLYALGPSLHHDLVLAYKVIRVLRAALAEYNVDAHLPPPVSDSLYYDTISILDSVILPTLSHLEANCCIADQIWSLVKLYPYQIRYSLYSRWKNDTYQLHAKLLRQKGDTLKKIKFIMKRVTKETIKPMGRHIGKLTHYSPGFLFDYMLVQIQTYDNLIVPVVDALKYLTCMSYDVLGYCIVEALVVAERDRFKHDGTSISLWLQSLAVFCGYIFKKYNIELTGLLQYLANQLKMQKSLDLLILKEVVQKMAGIEAAEEMTADQLEAMAGGELLKGEAGYFSQVRNTKRSSHRLKEALAGDNLAVALCLLMAQQRYCVIYRETEKSHLKLVGKLYDQCQDTLVQYGTFLASTLTTEEYVQKMPSIHTQLSEYHIHMDVAFFLTRPMFALAINQKFDALRKADPNSKRMSTANKTLKYCEAVSEVMSPVAASVRPLHPPKVWEDISPQFLVTFWSLTMYDLFVPTAAYDREIAKVKQQQAAAATNKELAGSKQKKEVERYATLVEKLQDEKKKQQEHVERVMARLKQEKDSWFLSRSAKSAKNETITQLLQLCLFPRCIFTTVDALYCAKFVHILHNLQTANFSTLLCYDRLFCDITYSVTSCTENEANRYGRFLCTMLETVMRWHSKKEIFDTECASYPGFVTKFRVSNQFSEASDNVGYENYRHVCHKWHYKITKAMIVCLESKDYVQIRNSIIILIKILPHYPILQKLAQCVEKKIEKIREDEKSQRQDLFVLATSYAGQLKARAPYIMRESDFHLVADKLQPVIKVDKPAADTTIQNVTVNNTPAASASKQINGESHSKTDKTIVAATSEMKKDSKERRLNRTTAQETSSSSQAQEALARREAASAKSSEARSEKAKEKSDKQRERELLEKQQKKEERREEAKRRAIEESLVQERALLEMKMKLKEEMRERYVTEMPLSKDGVVRASASGSGGGRERESGGGGARERERERESFPHPSQDSQLSSVSNSSSGSFRRTPDQDRVSESKRRKMEAAAAAKKQEERKIASLEAAAAAAATAEKAEKKERREKMKKRMTAEEEKELKKERKLSRKRDRLEESAAAMAAEQKRRKSEEKASLKSASHQNGDHLEKRIVKEKSHEPYMRERSHDREGREVREKHRRSGGEKARR